MSEKVPKKPQTETDAEDTPQSTPQTTPVAQWWSSPACLHTLIALLVGVVTIWATISEWNDRKRVAVLDSIESRREFIILIDQIANTCVPADEGCKSCFPPNLPKLQLDSAVQLQKQLEQQGLVSATEYLTLAWLGNTYWEYGKTETLCIKALAVSKSALDTHMAYFVLGHINFEHEQFSRSASREKGREYFQKAVDELTKESAHPRNRYFIGSTYAHWALLEACVGNDAKSQAMRSSAAEYWNTLGNRKDLICDLEDQLENMKFHKTVPPLPCPAVLYTVPSPVLYPEPPEDVNCRPVAAPAHEEAPLPRAPGTSSAPTRAPAIGPAATAIRTAKALSEQERASKVAAGREVE